MTDKRIALVAAPSQQDLIAAIAARLPVTGLFNPTNRPCKNNSLRLYSTFDELLHEAEICCFLIPYASLGKDLQRAVESGIHVLCAGPPSLSLRAGEQLCQNAIQSGTRLAWGGQFRHTILHQTLEDQVHQTAFGSPVFLRLVRGGGDSLLAAGWGAYQALEQTAVLLQTPIAELHVAGIGRQRRFHFALTVATTSGATAQLVVAPYHPSPVPDISLLGTGGLLSSTEYASLPARSAHSGISPASYPQPLAEPDWLADFICQPPVGKTAPDIRILAFFQALRSALSQALRAGRPILVHSPGPAIPLSSSR